jgi:hypothetical protein
MVWCRINIFIFLRCFMWLVPAYCQQPFDAYLLPRPPISLQTVLKYLPLSEVKQLK